VNQLVSKWKSNHDSFFKIGTGADVATILGRENLPAFFNHVDQLHGDVIETPCRLRIYKIFYYRMEKLLTLAEHYQIVARKCAISWDVFESKMELWLSQGAILDAMCTSLGHMGAAFYLSKNTES
jgi:hypothetical protein